MISAETPTGWGMMIFRERCLFLQCACIYSMIKMLTICLYFRPLISFCLLPSWFISSIVFFSEHICSKSPLILLNSSILYPQNLFFFLCQDVTFTAVFVSFRHRFNTFCHKHVVCLSDRGHCCKRLQCMSLSWLHMYLREDVTNRKMTFM